MSRSEDSETERGIELEVICSDFSHYGIFGFLVKKNRARVTNFTISLACQNLSKVGFLGEQLEATLVVNGS